MNFTNNNQLSDLAKCCELAALHERQKDDQDGNVTNEHIVGLRYQMAAELYDKASSASIGHNRSAGYDMCADNAKELSDIAFKKFKQRTKGK